MLGKWRLESKVEVVRVTLSLVEVGFSVGGRQWG